MIALGLKKILIVSHLIYPNQCPRSYRTTELALELARLGHDVTLFAALGNYDYSLFGNKYELKIKDLGKLRFEPESSDGQRKCNIIDRALSLLLGRILLYPSIELMWKIPKALRNENGYDQLISIAFPFPIHFGCAKAIVNNRNLTRQWIADCGDPFMGNRFVKYPFYFKFVEKWFCRLADYITVPTDNIIPAYYKEFNSKIRVIPQGFNFDSKGYERLYKGNNTTTFAYAGIFYRKKRDPSLFLDYLCTLNLDFNFIIYTNNDDLIRPYLEKLGNRLVIKKFIAREKLLMELSEMDFLVNIENIENYGSPSKLIDYALTKRPILSIGTDNIDRKKILDFLHGNYLDQLIIDVEKYDIKNVAKQFVGLIP